jgi:hypothetical protein
MNDPERWLTSEDAPDGMAVLLKSAQMVGPSAAERAVLATKLGFASSGVWLAASLKALALATLVGGGWMMAHDASTSSMAPEQADSKAQRAEAAKNSSNSEDAAPSKLLVEPSAPAPDPEDAFAGEKRAPEVEILEKSNAKKQPKPPETPSEATLIRGARAALQNAPDHALILLRAHEKYYPKGVLEEEREVLKLRALSNAGKTKAADAQKRKFQQAHPDSAHHVP